MTAHRHVCVVTSAHPADDVRVKTKIVDTLLEAGCRLTWVGPDAAHSSSSLSLDDRVSYLLTKPITSKGDRLLAARRAARRGRTVRDVDWWYTPDPDMAGRVIRLAQRNGGRVVFDIHEVFHESQLDRWLGGRRLSWVRETVRRRIARDCARADLVIGVSDSVLAPYVDEAPRWIAVRNCAPLWFASEVDGPVTGRGLTVMHGKAFPYNGTGVVVDAAGAVHADGVQVSVLMTGQPERGRDAFIDALRDSLAERGLQNVVRLRAPVDHRQMPKMMAECSVGLIAYGRDMGELSLPNRLFEYMAVGLAVLVPSYARDIKEIVDEERIGLCVDFEDPAAVAAALTWFQEHPKETARMGARARAAFLARHNWDLEASRLLSAMKVPA